MALKPTVSYVLGIYNADRTLVECLDSIFMQDYPKSEYEVIVIDGGSKDKTLSILKDYSQRYSNLRILHNPHKLSEGRGMSKDMGVMAAKGDFLVFLDHDNILLEKHWLKTMLRPFEEDSSMMATQSFLDYQKGDTNFLKYVNAIGIEDPFAVPHSLVAQVVLHPHKFKTVKNAYAVHDLSTNHILFGGANGCIFRKEVFEITGHYTRDVDVFARMADCHMRVAVPFGVHVYHKTSNDMLSFLKKKGIYFYRFIDGEYSTKSFKWAGAGFLQNIRFFLQVAYNLSLVGPGILALNQFLKKGEFFWLLHPFYTFFMTLEYGIITLARLENMFSYMKR
jgi:glycosyltransferase involved in cell wall biosynthesis